MSNKTVLICFNIILYARAILIILFLSIVSDPGDVLNQSVLKRIELPIVARDICLMRLKLAGSGNNFKLHDSFICAGGQIGKDTCEVSILYA